MYKILITGADSYIGTSFENYLAQWPERYQVDTVDMIDGSWREKDFSPYDTVFHVAGIAHQKETAQNAHLYYEVNRDLATSVAEKAKIDGVRQFIFLSTMAVYGLDEGAITKETVPMPKTHYGKAKYEAERVIMNLQDNRFVVATLRPPMVYGDGCKGNYQTLIKFAKYMPVFPNYENKRSMIHIDCLCEFVKRLIDECEKGLYLPQDSQYVCTCKMVQQIAHDMGRKMSLWSILNPFVTIIKKCTTMGKKAFGDLYYEQENV